jgi:inner membrane protein
MPTILSHPAVALGVAPWLASIRRREVLIAGIVLTALPDIDVLGLYFGIPYGHMFGHRGFTHSLLFAFVVSGLVGVWLARRLALSLPALWSYFGVCLASHAALDALTNGGLGVAFLAPFSNQRFFFEVRPILVSPIGASFFSARGFLTVLSEIVWVWTPLLALGGVGLLYTRLRRRSVAPMATTDR